MINRILEAICAVILALAVLIAFVSVIFRYVLGNSLSWSFEASIGLLTYLTFIGCYLAMRKNSHLKVDIFVNKMPRLGQFAVFAINQLLIVGIAWVMVYHGGRQAYIFAENPTLVMELPSGILYSVIPISGLLMGIDSIAGLVAGWHRLMNGGPAVVVEPASDQMDI